MLPTVRLQDGYPSDMDFLAEVQPPAAGNRFARLVFHQPVHGGIVVLILFNMQVDLLFYDKDFCADSDNPEEIRLCFSKLGFHESQTTPFI